MTIAAHATSESLYGAGMLGSMDPLQLFAMVVGIAFIVIAAAQLVASFYTDRLALRLFALRYLLAAAGWFFAHPQAQASGQSLPLSSMLVAVGLLWLTALALDVYLELARPRRIAAQTLLALVAACLLWLHNRLYPLDPSGIYAVLALGMALCAWTAWRAAAHESNAGHLLIAGAFLSYPVAVLAAALTPVQVPTLEMAYVVALPSGVVGIAVLVASLIRFGRRLERALRQREQAEQAVRELNATLEARVAARTEELVRLVQGLEGFVRNVSHDLRGPLAGVAGVARLAEDALTRGDTERAQRMIAPLAPQAERLMLLVQDLLALSRATSAECERLMQPMRPVVEAAVAQLALAPDTAELLKEVQLDVEPLPAAEVDAGLMQQLFVNLLSNALRFARRSNGRPTVRVGSEQHDGRTTFYVADNGPGFPPSQAHELFKPFTQLHDRDLSVNGIGLSIVQRIIERHRGRVWAELAAQGGAVFRFELDAVSTLGG